MFQVFVDSAANLPAVTAKKYDIHVVSFVNLVNGKELVCFDPDLSPEEELAKGKEYYNAMRTGCEIKTGLISTANFADAFRTALEADQDVIYPSLSYEKFLLFPQCTFHNLYCMGSMWKNRWNYAWKKETVFPLFAAISEKIQ